MVVRDMSWLSKPLPDARLRVLSLGAGVQSTVLALMAAKGEIGPRPDYMIFADTQSEPDDVYAHLDWLESEITRLTNGQMQLLRVTRGSLEDAVRNGNNSTGQRFVSVPFFTKSPDGADGITRRQCTSEYKIIPIEREIRRLLGLKPRQHGPKAAVVEQWIGISTDEKERVNFASKKYIEDLKASAAVIKSR